MTGNDRDAPYTSILLQTTCYRYRNFYVITLYARKNNQIFIRLRLTSLSPSLLWANINHKSMRKYQHIKNIYF